MIPTRNTIPYEAKPTVTYSLIALCVAAFAYQLSLAKDAELKFLIEYALVPARYTDGAFAAKYDLSRIDLSPFVTCMFLHGGWLHIIGNMWTLWVFGPALEDRLGRAKFLMLYMFAGLAAGLAHFIFNFFSDVPTIGASGAIAGIIGAYVRRFPYAWINVLQPIGLFPLFFYMPALLFAGIWFMTQIMQAASATLMPLGGGGVAWWAHVGGFLLGWFLLPRFAKKIDLSQEHSSMTQTITWPWRETMRWIRWWTRR